MSRDSWALLGFALGAVLGWATAYLETRRARRWRIRDDQRVNMVARLFESWSIYSKDGGWAKPWRN